MTSVLHVVWEYPPVIYGGLARHAEHLARAQSAAGWGVTVVTGAEDVTDPRRRVAAGVRERRGVRVARFRRPAPRTGWSDLLGAAGELDDALAEGAVQQRFGADVVHAHDWIGARAARTIARTLGVPLVQTVHATEWGRRQGAIGPEVDDGQPAAVHAREKEAVAAADAVLVCSSAMRAEVVDVLGADPGTVHVVPNAVDAASWRCGPATVRAARAHWLGDRPGPLIAAAGRIEWEKGFSTIVRALPDLRRAHPGLRLVLAGRGSYTPTITALASELAVTEHITLPGWLARRDLAALYAAADVVVVPSRYEPSGLVAREAQAAGATVISTRTGGLVEAVTDDETGLLIDPGDVHGLRDRITLLTTHAGRARRLAVAGSTAARALNWADVAATTLRVYAQAGSGRRARAVPAMMGP
jgi:glycogen synthase